MDLHRKCIPNRALYLRRSNARLLAAFLLSTLAMCLCLTGRASTKDKPLPWIAKDWTQWTSEDCGLVLNNSPWVQQTYLSLPSERQQSYRMTVVQLRSALPIRQALLRSLQLQKHYDKMEFQKKVEFDQQHAADIADRTDGNFVVLIENIGTGTIEDVHGNPLVDSPEPARQAALQLADDRFVLPIQTEKFSGETSAIRQTMNLFEYIFPRLVDGQPPFAPTGTIGIGRGHKLVIDEKTNSVNLSDLKSKGPVLVIGLGAPLIVDKKTGNVEQRDFQGSGLPYLFKAADLMYKGKLEY